MEKHCGRNSKQLGEAPRQRDLEEAAYGVARHGTGGAGDVSRRQIRHRTAD